MTALGAYGEEQERRIRAKLAKESVMAILVRESEPSWALVEALEAWTVCTLRVTPNATYRETVEHLLTYCEEYLERDSDYYHILANAADFLRSRYCR